MVFLHERIFNLSRIVNRATGTATNKKMLQILAMLRPFIARFESFPGAKNVKILLIIGYLDDSVNSIL